MQSDSSPWVKTLMPGINTLVQAQLCRGHGWYIRTCFKKHLREVISFILNRLYNRNEHIQQLRDQ